MKTTQEYIRQMARAYGIEVPDQQWVQIPLGSWELNPFYSGPEQQHPEDVDYED